MDIQGSQIISAKSISSEVLEGSVFTVKPVKTQYPVSLLGHWGVKIQIMLELNLYIWTFWTPFALHKLLYH